MKRIIALLLGALGLVSLSAEAHTRLLTSIPADEAVTTAPTEIVLTFSETVTLTAVSIAQSGHEKQELDLSSEKVSDRFVVSTPDLSPGEYVVSWRAIGVDTHVISGEIHFTVNA